MDYTVSYYVFETERTLPNGTTQEKGVWLRVWTKSQFTAQYVPLAAYNDPPVFRSIVDRLISDLKNGRGRVRA